MANTLTGLFPILYQALDVVSREMVGFIPAVNSDTGAERAALGETVTWPVSGAGSPASIAPAAYGPSPADTTVNAPSLTISKAYSDTFYYTGEEIKGIQNSGQYGALLNQRFAQSMRSLVNLIEIDLANQAFNAARAYGTAGTTPFGTAGDLTDVAQSRKILEDSGAPMMDLHMVLNTTSAANLRGKQNVLFRVNESGTDAMLRKGVLGELQGFNLHESAGLATFTKGTGTAYVTSGAVVAGQTVIPLITGSGTIKAGDVITIGADTAKYVVQVGIAAPGSITINKPGLLLGQTSGQAITVLNNYTPNLFFSRNALGLVTRAPALPPGGDVAQDHVIITDPVSGLSFDVGMYTQYRRIAFEVGIAWGTAALKSEHLGILLG